MANCEECNLHLECKNKYIEGFGSKKAKIMFVLECPDYKADLSDEIMSGNVGLKMRYYLDRLGIKFESCYFTYAIKCKPKKKQGLKKINVDSCREELLNEIIEVKPKVIIPMGRWAWQMFTENTSIKEFRGHFDNFSVNYYLEEFDEHKKFECKLLPTFSPDSTLMNWHQDEYVLHDIEKAKKYVKTGKIKLQKQPDFEIAESLQDLKRFENDILKADSDILVIDLEGTGLYFFKDKIILVGYCVDDKKAYIIPYNEVPKEHMKKYTQEEIEYTENVFNKFVRENKKAIRRVCRKINSDKRLKKVAHNAKFEIKFCRKYGMPLKNFKYDTVIMDALINENRMHDLNSAMEIRDIDYGAYDTKLWEYVGKSDKKPYSFVPPKKLSAYLAIDVVGDYKLLKKQLKELKEDKSLYRLYFKQQLPLLKLMAKAEYSGMKIDKALLLNSSAIAQGIKDKIIKKFIKITGLEDFNPGSTKQVSEYLENVGLPFEELKIKKGTNGYSTDKKALTKILRFAKKKKFKKFAKLLLEYREISQIKNTFIDGSENDGGLYKNLDSEDKVHPNFNIHTPRTGRLSSSNPNGQNLPRPKKDINVRNFFIPDHKNWVVWEADKSQLELRLCASIAGDDTMLNEFREGIDMHSRNTIFFNDTLEFFEKLSEKDFITKRNYKPPFGWESLKDADKVKKIKKLIAKQKELDEIRTIAKTVSFSLQYGSTAHSIAETFNILEEDVQTMIDLYLEKYWKINIFMKNQREKLLDVGYSKLFTGRKRRMQLFRDWINSEYGQQIYKREMYIGKAERPMINFDIQGTANEIYTKEKLSLFKDIKEEKLRARMGLSIHDGMVNFAHIDDIPTIKKLVEKHFNSSFGKGSRKVPLPADFEVYTRWKGDKIEMSDYDSWNKRIKEGYQDSIAKKLQKVIDNA